MKSTAAGLIYKLGASGKMNSLLDAVHEYLSLGIGRLNEERAKIMGAEKTDIMRAYGLSFEAHYRLVNNHPWADGNGRMSRLVMNMIQHEAGVILSVVKKESRAEYIRSLAESEEKGDSAQFIGFMTTHHAENLRRQIQEYRASMESDVS